MDIQLISNEFAHSCRPETDSITIDLPSRWCQSPLETAACIFWILLTSWSGFAHLWSMTLGLPSWAAVETSDKPHLLQGWLQRLVLFLEENSLGKPFSIQLTWALRSHAGKWPKVRQEKWAKLRFHFWCQRSSHSEFWQKYSPEALATDLQQLGQEKFSREGLYWADAPPRNIHVQALF